MFIPDRFMGSTIDYRGTNFEFTPFGAGRPICPGMLIGLANTELALATLLFHFDWALPDGILPGGLDMTEAMGITARRKEDLLLRVTFRIPMPC
jgi:cytochrome P450